MSNKAIIRNIIFSIIQIIGISLLLFIFYRRATSELGKETFGIWALVMGISSIANLGNFGFAGGLVKFTAEFYVLHKFKDIKDSLNLSVLFVSVFFAIICLIIYLSKVPIINYIIKESSYRNIAQLILPFSLFSLFLNSISLLFFSVIDGINKGFIKNIFNLLSTLIFVSIALLLIKNNGIFGIVYAQIAQSFFFLVASLTSVFFLIPQYSIFNTKWRKELFEKIFYYSINLQGIGIITLFYEPIIKGVLSKYSGLSAVSYYEIANKIVQQSKAFINLSVVNLIPKISALSATNQNQRSNSIYYFTSEMDVFVSLTIFLGLLGFSPLFSNFSFGIIDNTFLGLFIALCIANFINALSIPAFYFASAEGNLNILLFGNIIIISSLFFLIFVFNYLNLPNYIWVWVIALVNGSIYFILKYQNLHSLNYNWLFNFKIFIVFGLLLIITLTTYYLLISGYNNNLVIFIYLTYIVIINYFMIIKYKKFPQLNKLIENFKN